MEIAWIWPYAVWHGPLGIALTVAWLALVIGGGRLVFVRWWPGWQQGRKSK